MMKRSDIVGKSRSTSNKHKQQSLPRQARLLAQLLPHVDSVSVPQQHLRARLQNVMLIYRNASPLDVACRIHDAVFSYEGDGGRRGTSPSRKKLKSRLSGKGTQKASLTTVDTMITATSNTVVSDSEIETSPLWTDEEILVDNSMIWRFLMESTQLEVMSQLQSRTFRVYCLEGALRLQNVKIIQRRVLEELYAVYDGSTLQRSKTFGDCRVYAIAKQDPEETVWLQVNLGKSAYVEGSSGKSKPSAEAEFVCVLLPNSRQVALSFTGLKGRAKLARIVISAIDSALGSGSLRADRSNNSELVGQLTGSDPYKLLRDAGNVSQQTVVGRFAKYAADASASNPVTELEAASTGNLTLPHKAQHKRKKVGTSMTHLCDQIQASIGGDSAVVAACRAGFVVDHSMGKRRARTQQRYNEMGRPEDNPIRTSVQWDWKGYTNAIATADTVDEVDESGQGSFKFKYRLSFHGADVFAGMGTMIEAGMFRTPLPDFVRDAASLGPKIRVEYGAVVRDDDDDDNDHKDS